MVITPSPLTKGVLKGFYSPTRRTGNLAHFPPHYYNKIKGTSLLTTHNLLTKTGSRMPDKEKIETPKFIYNCVRCGQYCSSVDGVPVTLQDLLRWQASGDLGRLVTHLGLDMVSGFPRLVLKPSEGEERGCPVYDVESKDCGLYADLPLNCQAYPLGFNGEKYFVIDQACQGLGEGEMTTDKLRAQRDAARAEHEARSSSAATLPVMYGLVMRELMDQSRQAMESMTPEQKTELERYFKGGG